MTLGLLDDREDGEYNGVSFAEISSIFLIQNAICIWNKYKHHGESECGGGWLGQAINQCH